jgi:hypothetical protein
MTMLHTLESTTLPQPTPTGEKLRTALLSGSWIAMDAALVADLDAWMNSRLEWSPTAASGPVTRTDQIGAAMEGVRAGRLVPVERGQVVGYEDALVLEAVRSAALFRDGWAGDAFLHQAVAEIEADSMPGCSQRPVPCASDRLTRATIARLLAQVSETVYWSEQLGQSREADLYQEELGRFLDGLISQRAAQDSSFATA